MKLEAAKLFFIEKMNLEYNDILEMKPVTDGFSNDIFVVRTKSDFYYLRMTKKNSLIKREDEKNVLDKINFKYCYYDQYGNYIRPWIHAKHNKSWNKLKIKNISDFLKLLHVIEPSHFAKINYKQYEEFILNTKFSGHYSLYLDLLKKYEYLALVVCHNDLNPTNILSKKNDIFIIDYERVQLNTVYFELANLARENMTVAQIKFLCKHNNLNYDIFLDHLVITCIYGLQWTLSVENTESVSAYRKKVLLRLKKYLRLINHIL